MRCDAASTMRRRRMSWPSTGVAVEREAGRVVAAVAHGLAHVDQVAPDRARLVGSLMPQIPHIQLISSALWSLRARAGARARREPAAADVIMNECAHARGVRRGERLGDRRRARRPGARPRRPAASGTRTGPRRARCVQTESSVRMIEPVAAGRAERVVEVAVGRRSRPLGRSVRRARRCTSRALVRRRRARSRARRRRARAARAARRARARRRR